MHVHVQYSNTACRARSYPGSLYIRVHEQYHAIFSELVMIKRLKTRRTHSRDINLFMLKIAQFYRYMFVLAYVLHRTVDYTCRQVCLYGPSFPGRDASVLFMSYLTEHVFKNVNYFD